MAKTFMARVCDVEVGTAGHDAVFITPMRQYVGKTFKFQRKSRSTHYKIVNDPQWSWDRHWIRRIPSERPKPKKPKKVKLLNLGLNLWDM